MRYFDTASYREVANCREYIMGRELSNHIHHAIVIGFTVGVADAIFMFFMSKLIQELWINVAIGVLSGILIGYLLFRVWRHLDKEIKHRTKQVFWDIETLTWKIEALQEEYDIEEDYELVGETEKKKDEKVV